MISFRTADPGNRFEVRLSASYSGMDGWLKIRSLDAATTFGTAIATTTDCAPGSEQIFLR